MMNEIDEFHLIDQFISLTLIMLIIVFEVANNFTLTSWLIIE